MTPDLHVTLCGIPLKNQLIAASGTFGFGVEFSEYMDVSALGGVCSKGLTLNPRPGNAEPRMLETPAGMLNSVGLQNPGVKSFIEHELPEMKRLGTVVIANLGGGDIHEYVEGASLLDKTDIDILELNISCPNVKAGGVAFGVKCAAARQVVSAVRAATKKSLMVKLSPNAEDIADMARTCEAEGADALSLINTVKAMAIDIKTRRPVFQNVVAGLSGPCVKPIALRMVYDVAKAVKIPVVGLGGITSGADALEFIMAGAVAVQVGTANFINPGISLEILDEIKELMIRHGIKNLDEIRGCALANL